MLARRFKKTFVQRHVELSLPYSKRQSAQAGPADTERSVDRLVRHKSVANLRVMPRKLSLLNYACRYLIVARQLTHSASRKVHAEQVAQHNYLDLLSQQICQPEMLLNTKKAF